MHFAPALKTLSSSLLAAAAAGVLAVCAPPAAHAALLAQESFDYAPGSALVGANGGSGFDSPWLSGLFSGGAQQTVQTGSLGYPGLGTSGQHTEQGTTPGYWGVYRSLAPDLGADGTTSYLSFAIRATEGTVAADFFGLYLGGTNQELFAGKGGGGTTDQWVLEQRGGTNQVASGKAIGTDTTLLVLKMEFGSSFDTFSLFVNPTLGAAEPAADATNTQLNIGQVTGLGLFGSHRYLVDEIRLGDTFADVAPRANQVPEPAPWMLVLPALLLLASRRRQR